MFFRWYEVNFNWLSFLYLPAPSPVNWTRPPSSMKTNLLMSGNFEIKNLRRQCTTRQAYHTRSEESRFWGFLEHNIEPLQDVFSGAQYETTQDASSLDEILQYLTLACTAHVLCLFWNLVIFVRYRRSNYSKRNHGSQGDSEWMTPLVFKHKGAF